MYDTKTIYNVDKTTPGVLKCATVIKRMPWAVPGEPIWLQKHTPVGKITSGANFGAQSGEGARPKGGAPKMGRTKKTTYYKNDHCIFIYNC